VGIINRAHVQPASQIVRFFHLGKYGRRNPHPPEQRRYLRQTAVGIPCPAFGQQSRNRRSCPRRRRGCACIARTLRGRTLRRRILPRRKNLHHGHHTTENQTASNTHD